MSRIIICDRCKKRISKDAESTGYVNLDRQDVKTGDLSGKNYFDEWDLCDDCYAEILAFIQSPEKKPTATIKKMPAPAGKTITKPDWIKKLAKEGKTVKEICEITGCSEPTARKYKGEVTASEATGPDSEGSQED